jgi:hypothetical protein
VVKQLDLSKIKERLERIPDQFEGQVAQVGIPAGLNYENGTAVAYVAAIQEFGAPEVKIPARPVIRPTMQEHSGEWAQFLRRMVPRVGEGTLSAFDVLDGVGRIAVADMQAQLASVNSPPLSPITVLLRKWRKEGRTITGKTVGEAAAAIAEGVDPGNDNKPLNDSGLLMQSFRNAVNKEGGEFRA